MSFRRTFPFSCYDPNPADGVGGFRLRLGFGDGTVRQYDLDGRLKWITEQGGLKTEFVYDGDYLDKVVDPTGRTADYTITGGRVTKIEAPEAAAGSQRPVTEFAHDADGSGWCPGKTSTSPAATTTRSPRSPATP